MKAGDTVIRCADRAKLAPPRLGVLEKVDSRYVWVKWDKRITSKRLLRQAVMVYESANK